MKEKTKRFLVDVHADMHRDAKKAAADAGISLSKYILGAVRMRLAKEKNRKEDDKEL